MKKTVSINRGKTSFIAIDGGIEGSCYRIPLRSAEKLSRFDVAFAQFAHEPPTDELLTIFLLTIFKTTSFREVHGKCWSINKVLDWVI